MSEEITLSALFLSGFLAATLLPGGSEAVLFAVLKTDAGLFWPAVGIATVGNTLGGLTSYLLGRLAPEMKPTAALSRVRRFGSPVLLFAWAPVIGDALCMAAGWLRLTAWKVALFMALGKLARYLVVARLAG